MIVLLWPLRCDLGEVCAKFQNELAEGWVLKYIKGSFCTGNRYRDLQVKAIGYTNFDAEVP